MSGAVWASLAADSLATAERLTREWISWNPKNGPPHGLLGTVLLRREDYAGALAEFRRERELVGGSGSLREVEVLAAVRRGGLATLDSMLHPIVSGEQDANEVAYGLERQAMMFRESGRPAEALVAARRFRALVDSLAGGASPDPFTRLPEALALLQLGRTDRHAARAAADLFNHMASMAAYPEARMPRHRVWMWTHAATALALAGDTTELIALERRAAEMALRSAYGRDRLMPNYVHGLLLEARGDWDGAADAYRQAIWSPTENHVAPRLATVLLAAGRPAEAVGVLQSWLRGPIDAANQYVPRADVHALLAEAFRRLRMPDSAAVHDAWIRRSRASGAPMVPDRHGGAASSALR
jgi:tetratricopeptide (TPR) repeat protein